MAERGVEEKRRSGRKRASDGRLRAIVEQLADGIVLVGRDGRIVFANPAAEVLFGRRRTDLEGSELGFSVVSGENTEVEVVRPGGEIVVAELRVVDTDWDGMPAQLVSLRDVTDRRHAEEQARLLERERTARAEAEAANQAKSEFLAVMSHELRTPLNAVLGYADLLDLGVAGPLSAEQRRQIARIRTSGRHLLSLVNEVLDLAKIESGRLSVACGPTRAGAVADSAVALVQPLAEARGITLAGQCAGDGNLEFDGDEDRVRQILVNLLNNAVKFTSPGGSIGVECGMTNSPDAEARLHGQRRWVFMRVSDTGMGIPPERLPEIFEPFTQLSSGRTRSSDGSGLGLTISRRLARMMNGDLTARSVLGKGSTFTLWLPAADRTSGTAPWQSLEDPQRLHGLSEVGELLLREIESVLENVVARIRGESLVPAARTLRFSQLADHLGSYLADVAGMLVVVAEQQGRPSTLLADGTDIQRLVAERHGLQRSQLGWSPDALHREYAIVREEVERLVRRRARSIPDRTLEEALVVLGRFFSQAEEFSVRALERVQG